MQAGEVAPVGMRGAADPPLVMLTTLSTEELIQRLTRSGGSAELLRSSLSSLDGEFNVMYSMKGRRAASRPERCGTILMALCSIRSERPFSERLNYAQPDPLAPPDPDAATRGPESGPNQQPCGRPAKVAVKLRSVSSF